MRVALATCTKLPEPDHDEPLLLDALARTGVTATMVAWDDPSIRFADHDLIVLRSTWNYFERVAPFLAWAESTAATTRLLNPAHVVAWNVEKTYLADLERRGIAIVPTTFVGRGTKQHVEELLEERGWDEIVVKPVVSAGSFRTERFSRATAAAAQIFLDALVADRDVMVQHWMPSVDTYGERSLVWIDGEITHAIRKTPRFAGGAERVSGAVEIASDERVFAERALSELRELVALESDAVAERGDLLYARVDVVRDADEALRIMELELIEPSLFFRQSPAALARFATAIARRVG
jgi:glutathione synthase/RimK-type ligase-like ATP-grasp enzyme